MQHSSGGWLALVLIMILFISTNVWLLSLWKRKDDPQQAEWMKKLGQGLSGLWNKDARKLQDLSQQVDKLRPPSQKGDSDHSPSSASGGALEKKP